MAVLNHTISAPNMVGRYTFCQIFDENSTKQSGIFEEGF